MPPPPPKQPNQFLVHHQGQVQGPFDVDFIEAMIMSGVYPSTVLVENTGNSERMPFSDRPKRRKLPPRRFPPQNASEHGKHSGASAIPPSPEKQPKKTRAESFGGRALGLLFILVVIGIIVKAATSEKSPKSRSASPSTSPPSSNSYSPPAPTSPSPSLSSSKLPTYNAPTPPADTMVYRDSSGRTYRVSNSDYLRLSRMQTALSFKQSGLNMEEARLKLLAAEVVRDRATLDSYSQYAVDALNRKVDQVNSMNIRVQSLVDDYNRDVDAFNRDLERVGTPIN